MKLWILKSNKLEKTSVSPEKMAQEAQRQGINTEIYYYDNMLLKDTSKGKKLYYRGRVLRTLPNMVFFRGYHPKLVEYFTAQGVVMVNNLFCMLTCKNKYETHQVLKQLNIKQPETILLTEKTSYSSIIKTVGCPFILKDNFGQEGRAVYLINNEVEFLEALEYGKKILIS